MPNFIPYSQGERMLYEARKNADKEFDREMDEVVARVKHFRVRNYEIADLLEIDRRSITRKFNERRFTAKELMRIKAYLNIRAVY